MGWSSNFMLRRVEMNNSEPRNILNEHLMKMKLANELAGRNQTFSTSQQYVGNYQVPRGEEQSLLARTLGVISNTAQAGVRKVRGAFTRKQPPNIQKNIERREAERQRKVGGKRTKTKKGKQSKKSQSIKRLHRRM